MKSKSIFNQSVSSINNEFKKFIVLNSKNLSEIKGGGYPPRDEDSPVKPPKI